MGGPSLRCNWPCDTCGLAGFVFRWTWTHSPFHLWQGRVSLHLDPTPGLGRIISLGLDLPLCKGNKAGFLMPCPGGWVREQRNPALPSWLGPEATKSCLDQVLPGSLASWHLRAKSCKSVHSELFAQFFRRLRRAKIPRGCAPHPAGRPGPPPRPSCFQGPDPP